MRLRSISLLIAAVMALTAVADHVLPIPRPAEYTPADGQFTVPATLAICGADRLSEKKAVEYLTMRGLRAKRSHYDSATVKLVADTAMGAEGYSLTVTPAAITITAGTDAGIFYAIQTMVQLIDNGAIGSCTITDRPRFGYRSLMIDVSRYFTPVDELKRIVDMASRLKINTLHLHLTDDNGWRLEIKRYPRLTSTGAWRVQRDEIFPARANPREGEPTPVGGYYTQRQMRELVAYAARRHVTIVPEIEMPAHAVAAIASYPELRCPVDTGRFIGPLPGIGGYDARIICCAGKDSTFTFFENVLDEVMDIFPSEYIHIGGDEAHKEQWSKCPLCHKRMADEGLADHEELQGYFMDRISGYLRNKGRKAIGWDEIAYGNPREDITAIGWQTNGHIAVDYARHTGRNFIMSPASTLYLIRYQGPQEFEPFTYFGNNTLSDVYHYEPTGADWTPELESQLIGIQASMWTEFISNDNELEYMLFPRLTALADAAWRPKGQTGWPDFLRSMDRLLPTLDKEGVNYARSMFNLSHEVLPDSSGALRVTLHCERPDVEIRTSERPDMTEASIYTSPVTFTESDTLYAATFIDEHQAGKTLTLPVEFNAATAGAVKAKPSNGVDPGILTNGVRGSLRNSDGEWVGWNTPAAVVTVDMGKMSRVTAITIGNLANASLGIATPKAVYFYISPDGVSYRHISTAELPDSSLFPTEATVTGISSGTIDGAARYIRIVAVNPGAIPDGMPREGFSSWMYFDEIDVTTNN